MCLKVIIFSDFIENFSEQISIILIIPKLSRRAALTIANAPSTLCAESGKALTSFGFFHIFCCARQVLSAWKALRSEATITGHEVLGRGYCNGSAWKAVRLWRCIRCMSCGVVPSRHNHLITPYRALRARLSSLCSVLPSRQLIPLSIVSFVAKKQLVPISLPSMFQVHKIARILIQLAGKKQLAAYKEQCVL